ncbi:toxin-antitoxin system HicB family antitoxin [Haloechinothrix salitolerans]|uniref:Toxin-antitoxin system HicB family antitoxin n=1 Tax=Haloechinothrix salitolerans TaxID=926830 RepID=A0ABW2BZZ3_9PSEU
MKQLLLRVDDELHAQLTERAQRERRSVNALANEILSRATQAGATSPRHHVRARAAALGLLAAPLATPGRRSEEGDDRQRVLERTRGLGPMLDDLIDEDRDRA